jgi:hypothetical protein
VIPGKLRLRIVSGVNQAVLKIDTGLGPQFQWWCLLMSRSQVFGCFSLIALTSFATGCLPEEPELRAPNTLSTDKPKETPGGLLNMIGETRYVTVQHCLIGFEGSVSGKSITRSKEEASKLAEDLLKRARAGEDFGEIVKQYTDDSPPGIYKMANRGVAAPSGTYSRDGMVPAFGDVGFPLEVGAYGLAEHHPTQSPYGWHIIKRIE